MGRLRLVIALAALAFSGPGEAATLARWDALIAAASARFGIPQDWIRRVMRAESGGRTMPGGRPITSRAGAMGLMQVMPQTYREMARMHGLGPDPHAPRDNIYAGAAYLRAMYERFGYPGLFAAYNAGPARYAAHLRIGNALPAETRAYLAQVTTTGLATGQDPRNPAATRSCSMLFFVRRAPSGGATARQAAPALFVVGPSEHRQD